MISFVGRRNISVLAVKNDGTLLDLTVWTRTKLVVKNAAGTTVDTLDTAVGPGGGDYIAVDATGIRAQFGLHAPLVAGSYIVHIDLYESGDNTGTRVPVTEALTMIAP